MEMSGPDGSVAAPAEDLEGVEASEALAIMTQMCLIIFVFIAG